MPLASDGDAAADLLGFASDEREQNACSGASLLLSLLSTVPESDSVTEATPSSSTSIILHPQPFSNAMILHSSSMVVDEHTPVVLLAKTQPRGSTLVIEAGAGAGKTSLAERIISASRINAHGVRQQILATTMTKAGVNALKSKGDIPASIVKSMHALGYAALKNWYVSKMQPMLLNAGLDFAKDPRRIRQPKPHTTKFEIMCQVLMPPTEFDREDNMHAEGKVSVTYLFMHEFIATLVNKAYEAGLGQVGNESFDDIEALHRTCCYYELEGRLETVFLNLSIEMKTLCNRACALIVAHGAAILSDSRSAMRAAIESLAYEELVQVTATVRLHAALHATSYVLHEAVKVATRPGWRGKNSFTNAMDAKDTMQLPALAFVEMIALPLNVFVQAPIVSLTGQPYDVIVVDEAQDTNLAQAGLVRWAMGEHTQLIVIGDPLQRCFSFASATSVAFTKLQEARAFGNVETRHLLNNFRSSRSICAEIQKVLTEDIESDRQIRPTRTDEGEVLYNAHLRNGRLSKWLAEGTVAILSRLNSVLAAFQAFFLRVGQPYAILGQAGVLPQLRGLLDGFPDTIQLSTLLLELKQKGMSSDGIAQKDQIKCLIVFAASLLENGSNSLATPKVQLMALLEKAYQGSVSCDANAYVRGMPILGTGHSSKGFEFNTVVLAEPGLSMIKAIIDKGGEPAEDEKHLKYVLVSRARDRLVYLEDVFVEGGNRAIAELCTPLH